jgi:hypothetical protein
MVRDDNVSFEGEGMRYDNDVDGRKGAASQSTTTRAFWKH